MPNYKHDRKFFEEALNEVQNKDNALMHLYGNLQEQTNSQNQVLLNEIIGELIAGAAMMAPLAAAAYSRYKKDKEANREHALAVRREDELRRRHVEDIMQRKESDLSAERRNTEREQSEERRHAASIKARRAEARKDRKFRNRQGNKNRAQGTRDVILKSTLDPAMNPQQLQAAIDRARRAGLIS